MTAGCGTTNMRQKADEVAYRRKRVNSAGSHSRIVSSKPLPRRLVVVNSIIGSLLVYTLLGLSKEAAAIYTL
ncbi:hypothetical protein [Massilia horti]|uniref:hypothetical protein n=1 Tax=Massilia horti TaxID=2562153 RepID=UPI001E654612|nr:hypothetical protein [Massilia horti]